MEPSAAKRIKLNLIDLNTPWENTFVAPVVPKSRPTTASPSPSTFKGPSFAAFPHELISLVLRYLSPLVELPRVALVSSAFRRLLGPPYPVDNGFQCLYKEIDFSDRPAMDGFLISRLAQLASFTLERLDLSQCFRIGTQEIENLVLRLTNLRHLSISTSDANLGNSFPPNFVHTSLISLEISKQAWTITGSRLLPMRLLAAFPNLKLLDTDGFDATNWERVAQLCPKIEYISTGTVSVDTESLRSALRVWKLSGLKMPWYSYEYEKIGDELTQASLKLILLPRYQITNPDFLTQMSNLTTIKIIYNSWVASPMRLSLDLPHLEHLDMSGCADEVYLTMKCPQLKRLSFNRCRFKELAVEAEQLRMVDLSCAEMSEDLFESFISTGARRISTIDMRGFHYLDDAAPLTVSVRDILDGRSSHQAELSIERMGSCSVAALERLISSSGASLLCDLYVPLCILSDELFHKIISKCPGMDRLVLNEYTDMSISALLRRGGITGLRQGKFPPDAMPVSERFLEILSTRSQHAFVHLYCSHQSSLASPFQIAPTQLSSLASVEFSECDLPNPELLSDAIAALPNIRHFKFHICALLGELKPLQLTGPRISSVTLSQVTFGTLDLSSAPSISKIEIYRCNIELPEGDHHPLLRLAPETLAPETSKLEAFSMRRNAFQTSISSTKSITALQLDILTAFSSIPCLSTLRLDGTSMPATPAIVEPISTLLHRSTSSLFLSLPASCLLPPSSLLQISRNCFLPRSMRASESTVSDLELDAFGVPSLDATRLVALVEEFANSASHESLVLPKLFITGFSDVDARAELKMSSLQRKSNGAIKFDLDAAQAMQFQLEFEQVRTPPEVQVPVGRYMTQQFERAFAVPS